MSDLAKALQAGEAVYADGTREAVVRYAGKANEANAFDVWEHTKGEGITVGTTLCAREMAQILLEKEIPLDRGWSGGKA